MRKSVFILLLLISALGYCESESETIERCLEDINSGDVARRRRGAMVVGKYSAPEAMMAAVRCLSDQDEQVRQSALVSLTETELGIPRQASRVILRMMNDESVHIRRLVSSVLPELLEQNRRRRPAGRVSRPSSQETEQEVADRKEVLSLIEVGLKDGDASVRQNVLAAAPYWPGEVDVELLFGLLQEKKALTRLLALRALPRERVSVTMTDATVERLVQDESPEFREQLAMKAVQWGAMGGKICIALLKDKESKVFLAALQGAVVLRKEDAWEYLRDALTGERFTEGQKACLCPMLVNYPVQAAEFLPQLLKAGGMLEAEARKLLFTGLFGKVGKRDILLAVQSDDEELRGRAMAHLAVRDEGVTPELLRKLMESRYVNVRSKLTDLIMKMPAEKERGELVLDLCADEAAAVRLSAYRLLLRLRSEGWIEALSLALQEDDSQDVRNMAAISLSAQPMTDEIRKVLLDNKEKVSPYIRQRILQRCLNKNE